MKGILIEPGSLTVSVTAATRQEAAEIIRTALGADPHDLLYRGLD